MPKFDELLTTSGHLSACFAVSAVHDVKKGQMYGLVLKGFMESLAKMPSGPAWVDMLEQQGRLVQQLIALGDAAKGNKGRVEKKVERMRALLATDGDFK